MTTTYTWSIESMDRHTDSGVVHTARWSLYADDGDYGLAAHGSIALGAPAEGDPIVDYSNLTEELVCSWVCDALGVAECDTIKAGLQEQLDELHNPTSLSGKPW